MRRFVLAAVFVLGGLSASQAAEVVGTVKSVDRARDAVVLSDGRTYVLPEGVEAESVTAGEKVKVTFKTSKGRNMASALIETK